VLKLMAEENQSTVAIGEFTGDKRFDAHAGPGLEEQLCILLNKLQHGVVDPKSQFEIRGEYNLTADPIDKDLCAILIKARAYLAGEEKKEFSKKIPIRHVANTADLARLLGFTGHLTPDGSKKTRHNEVRKQVENPQVHITGPNQTLILSHPQSDYAVEMLVKPAISAEAQPRRAQAEGGRAFVPIAVNELYEIKVHNNSRQEVAVAYAIDGLDVFHFSEDRKENGKPKFTHFIIDAGKEFSLKGWHNTARPDRKDNFLSFLVTELGHGAASREPVKCRGQRGTIALAFSNSFPKGTARGGGETGFGPPLEVKQEAVERVIDPPHDFVAIRYNIQQ